FDGRTSYDRPPQDHVVGTQLWAGYTQRHFLQSIVRLYTFLDHSLGAPEEAQKFADATRAQFGAASYYPFVTIRTDNHGSPNLEEARAAADQMARQHPAMVAPKLWAELKPESKEGMARMAPDFHVFYNPELPRETSFEAGKRIVEIGV